MQPHDRTAASRRSIRFFELPREIRDEVYKQYCFPPPRSSGPLQGYVDVPSASPLSVCKQMRTEFQPILYKGLEHTILQDRVCLKLNAGDKDSGPRYAGWNVWYHDDRRTSTLWIRNGPDETKFASWWIDAVCLYRWCSDLGMHSDATWLGFRQLDRALEKLQDLATNEKKSAAVKARLRYVCRKLGAGLAEAESWEDVERLQDKQGMTDLTLIPRMNPRMRLVQVIRG